MTLADAVQTLQSKIDSANREITFGGVAIDSRLVSWIGPFAVVVLLLYLLLHLSHVRAVANTNDQMLCSFPWIGLFPRLGARIFVLSSLAIFPAGASFLVFRRFNLDGPVKAPIMVMIVIIGIACCVYAYGLQKQCQRSTTDQSKKPA